MTWQHGDEAQRIAAGIRRMLASATTAVTLDTAIDYTMEMLPGATSGSVTLLAKKYAGTPVCRGDTALALDQVQYDLDEGPCLDAATKTEFVHSADLNEEDRWPAWTPQALEIGVVSVVCYRLFSERDRIGALNLYSDQTQAFDSHHIDLGLRLAAQISSALTAKLHDEALSRALDSRTEIGQAQGILMAQRGLTADQAFETLSRISQNENRKLRDIAADIARTGELPKSRRMS
jgi:GAF domain-containing protein